MIILDWTWHWRSWDRSSRFLGSSWFTASYTRTVVDRRVHPNCQACRHRRAMRLRRTSRDQRRPLPAQLGLKTVRVLTIFGRWSPALPRTRWRFLRLVIPAPPRIYLATWVAPLRSTRYRRSFVLSPLPMMGSIFVPWTWVPQRSSLSRARSTLRPAEGFGGA